MPQFQNTSHRVKTIVFSNIRNHFSQWRNKFHLKAGRRNRKQTVENSISTINHKGHAWFGVVGHVCPWEIAGRERGSCAWVWLTPFTAPLGISPEPHRLQQDAHQHASPRTTVSGAHTRSPRASNHTFLCALCHTKSTQHLTFL